MAKATRDLSVAISVYDKLHELGILVDVIRQHFGDRAFVHVICNDTGRQPQDFADIDLDELRIEARLELQAPKYGGLDPLSCQILQLRILDQVTSGLDACARLGHSDYTIHLHADAWPLRRDGLLEVIEGLRQNQCAVGLRGYGFAYTPVFEQSGGSAQDMFLVADNRVAAENGLFDCDLEDLLPTRPNIHGLVAQLLKFRLGARRTWWYSDLTDTVGWANTPHRLSPHSAMCPLNLDPARGLLHLERTRFLDDDGYRFMSKYLWEFGVIRGRHIEAQLRQFPYEPNLVEQHEQRLRQLFPAAADVEARLLRDLMPVELRTIAGRGELPVASRPHPEFMTIYRDNLELLDAVAEQLGVAELCGVLRFETGSGMLRPWPQPAGAAGSAGPAATAATAATANPAGIAEPAAHTLLRK